VPWVFDPGLSRVDNGEFDGVNKGSTNKVEALIDEVDWVEQMVAFEADTDEVDELFGVDNPPTNGVQ